VLIPVIKLMQKDSTPYGSFYKWAPTPKPE